MIPIKGNIHLSFIEKIVIKAKKKRVNKMDEPKSKEHLLGQTCRRKDKRGSTPFPVWLLLSCQLYSGSKLILSNGLHEESCHAHARGCKENTDGSWKTRLLKEKPSLLVKAKNFSQEKSLVPMVMERKTREVSLLKYERVSCPSFHVDLV